MEPSVKIESDIEEWIELLKEARNLGLSIDDIRIFLEMGSPYGTVR
jgi:DNA-binding transcriptional MerR regulator